MPVRKKSRQRSVSALLKKIKEGETKLKILQTRLRLNKANSRTNQNIINNAKKMKMRGLTKSKRRSKKFIKNNPDYNQGN